MLRLHAFSGGKEEVYLVTNVIEKSRLSTAQMRQIYQARWGVETYYRDLKQTFSRAKMLSKTPDNAQLELDWSIIGLWAICLYGTARVPWSRLRDHVSGSGNIPGIPFKRIV